MKRNEFEAADALNSVWDAAVGGQAPRVDVGEEERFVAWLHASDAAPMPDDAFLTELRARVVRSGVSNEAPSKIPRLAHRRRTAWWLATAVAAAVVLAALWSGERLLPSDATASIAATIGAEIDTATPILTPHATRTARSDPALVIPRTDLR